MIRYLAFLTLLFAPLAAAQTEGLPGNSRLHQLPIQKFVFASVTEIAVISGSLDILFAEPRYQGLPRYVPTPAGFPEAGYEKPLIAVRDWEAYAKLGATALANFALQGDEFVLEGIAYRQVVARDDADYYFGQPINLSTRAFIGTGDQVAIAGLVVQKGPALVLIRGIGPTLAQFGVPGVLADPFLTLFDRGTAYQFNNNWSENSEAARIQRITTALGTFPLPAGSKDAVILADLSPGAYTVHLEGADRGVGNGMIEIYVLRGEVTSARP